MLDAVGSQVLPVLLVLPDVDVPAGTSPTFTDAQVLAAVEETLGEGARGCVARSPWPPVSPWCAPPWRSYPRRRD